MKVHSFTHVHGDGGVLSIAVFDTEIMLITDISPYTLTIARPKGDPDGYPINVSSEAARRLSRALLTAADELDEVQRKAARAGAAEDEHPR